MATFRASGGDAVVGKGNKKKKGTKQPYINDPPPSVAVSKRSPAGWFKLQAVRAWTCGLDDDTDDSHLLEAKIPSQHVWVERSQYGLVASAEDGLMIKRGWGPACMHHFFHTQLPLLFEFLARDHPWIMTIDANDDVGISKLQLLYVALARVYKRFEILKVSHPRANDYHSIMARPTASWTESYIYIATRATIEPETYLKPTPVGSTAAGSGKGKQVGHSSIDLKRPLEQISFVSEDDEIDKFIENGLCSRSPSPTRRSKKFRKVIADEGKPPQDCGGSTSVAVPPCALPTSALPDLAGGLLNPVPAMADTLFIW
ncbi:hypothetical protein WOLCODRAFT_153933 [Wolfiporia cocos MD-104 SS10]|uniref:Uncharacterized protein n=1 Tax=Wolfiporia cocos (strain MD-104) TaxID=742152 RepID=A0A2H3JNW4_WOLCO|nr:hypothetical protein WOLCODRAFT_153933 [Wolfiporia cocos MD-104 SS10]